MSQWAFPVPLGDVAFSEQPDLFVLAQTVLGEAEGEHFRGKVGVAWCVINRSRDGRWPKKISEVCLQPKQFSCFNKSSPRLKIMREIRRYVSEKTWQDCFAAATLAYLGLEPDPTGGSNHYVTLETHPRWAKDKEPTSIVGGHKFWKL